MKKKQIKIITFMLAFVITATQLPLHFVSVSAAEIQLQSVSGEVYNSLDDAAAYIRAQMIAREENISVSISYSAVSDMNNVVRELMDKAVEYKRGDSGQAGDALKCAVSGWRCTYSWGGAYDSYEIDYNVTYKTTQQQERVLTERVNYVLAGLELESKTPYEKIKTIYDYICDNVDYDYEGLADSSNKIKYTAYSALINGKAVCEGYAALFYRMCMDAGIQTRIIVGIGNGGAHAWNIVEINGLYYNVDVTWDGQGAKTTHDYFLKSDECFNAHNRDDKYKTAEFYKAFPMSESSYLDYGSLSAPLDRENYEYSFITMDGKNVSTSASGKPKVIIFFACTGIDCQQTIGSVAKSDFNDIDIICVDISPSDDTEAMERFRNDYGNSEMDFCNYGSTNITAMREYMYAIPGLSGGGVCAPIIAYIDSDNMLQMVTSGGFDAGTIRKYLNYYNHNKEISLFVEGLYSNILSRDAAQAEIDSWVGALQSGNCTAVQATDGFIFGEEYESKNTSDEDFIKMLYRTLMEREPQQSEVDDMLKFFDSGVSRRYIYSIFVCSNEFTAKCSSMNLIPGEPVITEYRDQNLGVTRFMVRCYEKILQRTYDVDGLNGWCSALLSNSMSPAEVAAAGFIHSDEFESRNVSDDEFVRILYRTFMDREPDQGGFDYWVNELAEGISKDYIINGFLESQEFTDMCTSYGMNKGKYTLTAYKDQNAGVTKFVFRLYRKALGREPEENGLNGWCECILSGTKTPLDVAKDSFLNSEEFLNKNLNDEEFVKTLYRTFMGREADEGGLAGWVSCLRLYGWSRDAVIDQFAGSQEFRDIMAQYGL